MKDAHSRDIKYLRLSLTERCGINCVYCKSGAERSNTHDEITPHEAEAVVDAMLSLGVSKVRITGGEPLMRSDLEEVIRECSKKVKNICLTTNAQGLAARASNLKDAGLTRVNISLDSLKEKTYERITRGGNLKNAVDGIEAALKTGLTPVKLNCVVMRGINDNEIDDFINLARTRPLHIRFIELMPIGGMDASVRIDTEQILSTHPYLKPVNHDPGSASVDYSSDGFLGTIGFISPVSKRFCNDCSRVRVTSDMKLKPCLGSNIEYDLREAMREDRLYEVIKEGIYNKPEGHHFVDGFSSVRDMSEIGG